MRNLLHLILLFISFTTIAQTGEVDQTFNPDDIGWFKGSGFNNGDIKGIIELPDGDFIAVGNFTGYQMQDALRIARIDVNGDYSPLLQNTEFISSNLFDILLQPDGKILVCGNINYNSVAQNIIRIGEFGAVDPTFQPLTGANGAILKMHLLNDGRILIYGNFSQYDGQPRSKLAILHPDGTLDTTFDPGTSVNFSISALNQLPDGTLLLGGNFTMYNGTVVSRFVALNEDGTISSSYAYPAFDGEVLDVLVLPDGSIIVHGSFSYTDGNSYYNQIVKFDPSGAVVPDFITPLNSFEDSSIMAVDPDGKIVIAGIFGLYAPAYAGVIRLNADGSLDETFSHSTTLDASSITGLIVHDDGSITVAGAISEYHGWLRNDLFRLMPDGNVSNDFHRQYGPSSLVYCIKELADGKLLVSGEFEGYDGVVTGSLVRLLPDGTLDETFQHADFDGAVTDFVVQPDGKILIVGDFLWIEGEVTGYIARLEADGTWDPTFNVNDGFNGAPDDILLLQTGKILVSGGFSEYANQPCPKIVRLNTDGTRDATFAVGLYVGGGSILSMALDAVGNIICGGDFSTVESDNVYGLCKLSSSGVYSSTFENNLTFSMHDVNDVVVDHDNGKIYICGYIEAFGAPNAYVLRMNANGSVDTSYHPVVYSSVPKELYLMDNKKLIVAGTFNSQFGNIASSGVVRLLEEGSYDPSFDIGVGLENDGYAIELLASGDIMIGGYYQWIDSVGVSNLARLKSCDIPVMLVDSAFVGCDEFEMPLPIGYDLTTNIDYYDDSIENNGSPLPSWTVSESQVVWLRDFNACGESELPIDVTIYNTPIIDPLPDSIFGCFTVELPEITGQNLTENVGYYHSSHTTVPNQFEITNLSISTPGDFFIYDIAGICPAEVEFYVAVVPTFTVNVSYNNFTLNSNASGDSYQWVLCGDPLIPIDGATDNSYQPTQTGTYALIVNRDGCEKMSSCIEVTEVSVSEFSASGISVYPNPANDRLNLVLADQTEFYLYDMLGHLVRNEKLNRGNQTVELTGLSAGSYVLKMRTGDQHVIMNLVIEH